MYFRLYDGAYNSPPRERIQFRPLKCAINVHRSSVVCMIVDHSISSCTITCKDRISSVLSSVIRKKGKKKKGRKKEGKGKNALAIRRLCYHVSLWRNKAGSKGEKDSRKTDKVLFGYASISSVSETLAVAEGGTKTMVEMRWWLARLVSSENRTS
jgi:hypothetical protein